MKKIIYLLFSFTLFMNSMQGQTVILDFEKPETSRDFQYFGSGLDGQKNKIINNPSATGLNTSLKVAEFVKPADAQTWAGAFITPDFDKAVDLSKPGSLVCMKVWMNQVGNVALKFEGSTNNGPNWTITEPVNKAKEWVEICFDVSKASIEDPFKAALGFSYKRIVVFVDFGKTGAQSAGTSYLDDFILKLPPAPGCKTVLDFEVDSTSTVFQYFGSGLDGQKNKVVNNPAATAGNDSKKVIEIFKPADSQTWGGAFSSPNPKIPVSFAAPGSKICMKVWMKKAGVFAVKLEGASTGGANWVQQVEVPKAKEWVEICFDPTLPSLEDPKKPAASFTYQTIVLFPDFGKTGAASSDTNYIDDIKVCTAAAPTKVDVDFAVDMKKYTGAFQTVYISGTFNNWSDSSNPLQDTDKDGIWTTRLSLDPGTIQYKFQLDKWAKQEEFTGTETCTVTDGGFTNRNLVIPASGVKKDTFCFNSCYACGKAIKFTVNLGTQHITVAPTGIFIAGGGNFGVPGNFPLKDADKDGIYSITFERPIGFTSYYTFTNGACADYSCKEIISGQACANADNYNDRKMGPFTKDTILNTCFGQCTTTASCGVQVTRKVTFRVNMKSYTKSFVGVYVSGQFNEWSANKNPLKDDDNDKIWTAEISLPDGKFEFKYQIDGWTAQEEFKGGEACTVTSGGFTNRVLTVSKDSVLSVACFNACTNCTTTDARDINFAPLFSIFPNPATDEIQLNLKLAGSETARWMLMDALGRICQSYTLPKATQSLNIDVSSLQPGFYWAVIYQGEKRDVRKLVINP